VWCVTSFEWANGRGPATAGREDERGAGDERAQAYGGDYAGMCSGHGQAATVVTASVVGRILDDDGELVGVVVGIDVVEIADARSCGIAGWRRTPVPR
jgi:hypothetical protein